MMNYDEILKQMKIEESRKCLSHFEFESYENIERLSYLDLNKAQVMIDERREALWENTWIDGEIRLSTDEESEEWRRLDELSKQIGKLMDMHEGVDSKSKKTIWELLDELDNNNPKDVIIHDPEKELEVMNSKTKQSSSFLKKTLFSWTKD